jgi:sugar lactone lactonase YvrE
MRAWIARTLVVAAVLVPATGLLAADALPSYGLLQLRGVPDGARIDLDGRPWLVAEGLDGRWLVVARGPHRLTIHVPDHEPREQRIDVVDGRAQVVHLGERPVKRR